MTNQNKVIAQAYLKQALQHKYSEVPIRGYIKFMDSLSKAEKNKILLDREITKLIDRINTGVDREIELRKGRQK